MFESASNSIEWLIDIQNMIEDIQKEIQTNPFGVCGKQLYQVDYNLQLAKERIGDIKAKLPKGD